MASGTVPPPRPSRANTATLNDLYHDPNALASRRLSTPGNLNMFESPTSQESSDYLSLSTAPSTVYGGMPPSVPPTPTVGPDRPSIGNRSRSGTATKGKKGMLGFMSDFLNSSKRPEISTPYDPVHLTHVGFNSSTGEFTGLPKEWQQLLQDSGISKLDQEKNPLAVMEIVKFYQEGGGDVWDKMGHAPAPIGGTPQQPKPIDESLYTSVRFASLPVCSALLSFTI